MKRKWINITAVAMVLTTAVGFPIYQEATQNLGVGINTDSAQKFIESIGPIARVLAAENDLYGSIMVAQAVLESGYGKSTLSQPPNNNLYGVKAGPNYSGPSVAKETTEYDSNKNLYYIVDRFKVYNSPAESMMDYVKIFTRTAWYKQYYAGVFRSTAKTYQAATAALTGTYATDINYEKKLNQIIEQYNLTQYDVPEDQIVYEYHEGVYTVKKGDTLSSISNEVNESVDDIKFWNGIEEGVEIAEGQQLIIIKKAIKYIGERPIEAMPTIKANDQEVTTTDKEIPKDMQITPDMSIDAPNVAPKIEEPKEIQLQEQPKVENIKEEIKEEKEVIEYKKIAEKQSVYTVGVDETLYSVAKKLNMTIEEIKEINQLDEQRIKEGQKLLIKETNKEEKTNKKEKKEIIKEVIKTIGKVEIKETADNDSKNIGEIAESQEIILLEKQKGWIKVQYANYVGWIDENKVKGEYIVEKIEQIKNNYTQDYVVKENDNIYKIASKFDVTVEEILQKNGFVENIKLKKGQTIKIR